MSGKNWHRGFTVMEMMVAIGLLVVMSAMALPVMSQVMAQYQLLTTADELAFEIGRARAQAVAQSIFVRIRVEDHYYVRERSADGATYSEDDAPVALPAGMSVSVTGFAIPTFNRAGLAAGGTSITFQNTAGVKTVSTNVVGRVKVS